MKKQRLGFTLVEVLIVVVVLGILAATVLPQFKAASSDAKESALVSNLTTLRSQIQLFRFQHEGKFPADGSTDGDLFADHLTKRSDIDGTVNETNGAFGPYVMGKLPPNPFNNLNTVTVATTDGTPDDSTGWLYNSTTGVIKPNSVGSTPSGKTFASF